MRSLSEKGQRPDVYRMTTTLLWKRDVFEFSDKPEFKDKICLELGCWDCYTSVVLSHLFKKVYALQQMEQEEAQNTIKQYKRENIELVVHDLYKGTPIRADIIVIDADHEYDAVLGDIKNSLALPSDGKKYFVFDDYGIIEPVRRAINHSLHIGTLKLVQKIGWKQGTPPIFQLDIRFKRMKTQFV